MKATSKSWSVWSAVIGTGTLAACGATDVASTASPDDILVSVRTGTLEAPDSVRAGWRRVHVEEDGDGHIVVIFRLLPSASDTDVASFLAALDTTSVTPQPGVAIGGPEVGDPASASEPRASHVVRMADFAYAGAEKWAAGEQLLRIENTGKQDHQMRIVQLRPGSSMQAWMNADDPDTQGTTVAGIARVGPGQVAFLPVDLKPGAYVVYCLVSDPATRRPHVELGMLRSVQVE